MLKKNFNDLNDISNSDWISHLPVSLQPYIRLSRLDRPIGIWLMLLPCIGALINANQNNVPKEKIFIFSLGTFLMRSIGCIINDICDQNFDKHVQRTRFRPLANGEIKINKVIIFLLIQLILCGSFLIFVNNFTKFLAFLILPVVFLYPICKRFTYWPQLILGICFNWGILMAWCDTQNYISNAAIFNWIGAISWQIGYDSIYAYVDAKDDRKLGIFSTALLFKEKGKQWIAGFYFLAIIFWFFEGYIIKANIGYYIMLFLISLHLSFQISLFNPNQASNNFNIFRSNIWIGLFLVAAAYFSN
ncbi:MAG: 4-hydroxybenzoate octaprenyltransferase [Bordetella sp.]|nr:MAG: 4-hydroxybenzoate octaprenyltransferase [Bordetella sp.]